VETSYQEERPGSGTRLSIKEIHMSSRSKTSSRISVLFSLLLLVASQFVFGGPYAAMMEMESFQNATETKILRHSLLEDARGTELRLKLTLQRGDATVRLRDAAGTVRWEKKIGLGVVSQTKRFEGKYGEWRVELQLQNATGRYNIRLVDF
jgi:hypothetical protein